MVAATAIVVPALLAAGAITTVAGNGTSAYSGDGGAATSASLQNPTGVHPDGAGNLFIADTDNSRVRKVSPSGTITTVAGNGTAGYSGDGGAATAAKLHDPTDVVVDAAGNLLIADSLNDRVRKVSPSGMITTVAGNGTAGYTGDGGAATSAKLNTPVALALDAAGTLVIADSLNDVVRKVDGSGIIRTVAGTGSFGYSGDGGPATSAKLHRPTEMAVDGGGNLLIADGLNDAVRKVSTAGTITTVVGTGAYGYSGDGGPATAAKLAYPKGLAVDGAGNLLISDSDNHRIRKVNGSGTIFTVAGTGTAGFSGDGGSAASAQLDTPARVALTSDGDLFVSDTANDRVRRITAAGSPLAPTVSGTAPASPANYNAPRVTGAAQSGSTVKLYTDSGCTSAVAASGTAATFSSPGLSVTVADDSTTTFHATATNSDGDVSPCSPTSATYIEDSSLPSQPSFTSSPGGWGADRTPTWGFSGEPGATFECRLDRGGVTISAFSACTSPRTYDLTSEPDGTYTFTVRAKDADGNLSVEAAESYYLDATAPAEPTLTSRPGAVGTTRTPAWSFTADEPGARFECKLTRGATVVFSTASCASPRTYDLAGQPDGTYTFHVRVAADRWLGGGLMMEEMYTATSAWTTDTYALDTAAPAAPSITATPGASGSGRSPDWGFSGEAGASFECKLARGATIVSDFAACTSPKGYDLSSEPDGAYTFSVRATDPAGNVGAASTSDYTLNSTAPAAPTIDSSPGAAGTGRAPGWGFSGPSGASFECRLTRGATVVADFAACTSPKGYDLTGEPDGTYTFSVRAVVSGQTSALANDAYRLDTTAPDAPAITSSPGPAGGDKTPAWGFSGEVGASFECKLARGATVISDFSSCTTPKGYDLGGEPDGTYTFSVRAVDAVGNVGPAAVETYALDTTPPAAPAITASPGATGTERSPAWAFSADAGANFECKLARGATVISDFSSCTSPKGYDLTGQPDGSYTFSVRAVVSGQTSASSTHAYALDTDPPDAPAITASPGATGSDRSPTWGFSAEAGARLECRLARGATVISDFTPCSASATYDLAGEPDGTYVVSVRATDAAGNAGSAATDAYVLDTAAEAPRITSAPGALGRDPSPAWSFSAEPGASFECKLARGSTVVSEFRACTSPKGYDLSGELDGGYTFIVRATDAAGNLSAATSDRYALDTAAGTPTITSAPGAVGRDPSPAWTFSGEADESFQCRLSRGEATIADFSPCASPKRYELASEPDGTYTFTVRGVDSAGNLSPVTTDAYALDTRAGAPRITASPRKGDASPAWTFSGEPGASFECRLERGSKVVVRFAACTSPKRYDLADEPDGTYTFGVRATDAAGNLSSLETDDHRLERAPEPVPEAPGPAGGPGEPPPGPAPDPAPTSPEPSATTPGEATDDPDDDTARAPSAARRRSAAAARRAGAAPRPAGPAAPRATPPDRERESGRAKVARVLKNVARAAAVVAEKSTFPVGLLFLVVGFVFAQDRIDRRDPKLMLAPVFADPDLEFLPPN